MLSNECLGETLFTKFDLECYAAYTTGWVMPDHDGPFEYVIDQGKNDVPSYRIFAVDQNTLKVIYQPKFEARRTETALHPSDVVFEYMGRNNIFGWTEDSVIQKKIYTLNTKSLVMTVLELPKENMLRGISSLNVFACKQKSKTD